MVYCFSSTFGVVGGEGIKELLFQGEWKIVDNIAIGLFIFCFIECLFPYLCGVIT